MKNISLESLIKEILELGLSWPKLLNQKKKGDTTTWKDEINLTSWHPTEWEQTDLIFSKNQLFDDGKTQEVSIRILFKTKSSIEGGYVTIPVIGITGKRNTPVGTRPENGVPSVSHVFEGLPWEITKISYCASPASLNSLIHLEIDLTGKKQ